MEGKVGHYKINKIEDNKSYKEMHYIVHKSRDKHIQN